MNNLSSLLRLHCSLSERPGAVAFCFEDIAELGGYYSVRHSLLSRSCKCYNRFSDAIRTCCGKVCPEV